MSSDLTNPTTQNPSSLPLRGALPAESSSATLERLMQLEKAEFTPAVRDANVHKITRPSLSYWQDAWIRLKKNKQALASLYIVIALLLFTSVGPLLWRVDS